MPCLIPMLVFRQVLREGHEAEFVDDQQFIGGDLLLEAEQLLLVASLHQFVDQRGGGGGGTRRRLGWK